MESWLSIPEKTDGNRKKKRIEWKKQLVIVSSRKIFFYNTEKDKSDATPSMILDIRYLSHICQPPLSLGFFSIQLRLHVSFAGWHAICLTCKLSKLVSCPKNAKCCLVLNTRSRLITEVKHRRARTVLGWGIIRQFSHVMHSVLLFFFFHCFAGYFFHCFFFVFVSSANCTTYDQSLKVMC